MNEFNYLHWATERLNQEYQYKLEQIMLKYEGNNPEARFKEIESLKIPTKKQIFALANEAKAFVENKE